MSCSSQLVGHLKVTIKNASEILNLNCKYISRTIKKGLYLEKKKDQGQNPFKPNINTIKKKFKFLVIFSYVYFSISLPIFGN